MLSSNHVRTLVAGCVLLVGLQGCTPVWTGNRMEQDLETVKAQQQAMLERHQAEREELTQMIAGARSDVVQLQAVLAEARDLLQRNNADLGVEIQQTREEVERLRGKTEEIEFRFLRLEQALEMFREDVDLRFAGNPAVAFPQNPDELFEFASKRFEIGDYRVARQAFEAFLQKNARHARADEATYLLGETYFMEEQWVSAIFEYQKVLQNHSGSQRRAAATYRIGESFAKMGKCQEAGVFFETIVNDHPGSRYVRDARQHLQAIKGGRCG